MVPGAVSSGMLAHVRRRLSDDQNLVDVSIVDFTIRVLIGPVGERVASAVDLLHLLVEHEVQLLRLVLVLACGRAGLNRRPRLLRFLRHTVHQRHTKVSLNSLNSCIHINISSTVQYSQESIQVMLGVSNKRGEKYVLLKRE